MYLTFQDPEVFADELLKRGVKEARYALVDEEKGDVTEVWCVMSAPDGNVIVRFRHRVWQGASGMAREREQERLTEERAKDLMGLAQQKIHLVPGVWSFD